MSFDSDGSREIHLKNFEAGPALLSTGFPLAGTGLGDLLHRFFSTCRGYEVYDYKVQGLLCHGAGFCKDQLVRRLILCPCLTLTCTA